MSKVHDNAAARQYELELEGGTAFAGYRDEPGAVRAILHVETPVPLRGRGVAAQLMDGAVAHARANGIKLRAVCPYAVAYFRRYPAARDVSI